MRKLVAGVIMTGFLVASFATASPATVTQDHEADWLVALGPPGPLGSGGCNGALIVVPRLKEGEGIWYARMDVDRSTWGTRYTVRFSTETGLSINYLAGTVGVTFLDKRGEVTGSGTAGGYDRIVGQDRIARGKVPRRTTTAAFWACEDIGPFAAVYHAGGSA